MSIPEYLPDEADVDNTELDIVRERRAPFWKRHWVLLTFLVILAAAAFFRFFDINFDQGHLQHPDERFIVGRTMEINWPSSFSQFLDPNSSPLNTRQHDEYPYGSLPVYLVRATGWVLDTVLPPADGRPKGYYLSDIIGVTLLGRTLSGIFDLLTILFVFLIARRLYSSGTALIASALSAFAVTQIQIAHFYASDTFLVTFMMGALYFSVVMMQRPSWLAALGAGVFVGLAVASKVSVGAFALVVVAAVILRAAYRQHTRKLGAEFGDPVGLRPATVAERDRSLIGHLLGGLGYLVIAAVSAFLAFAVTEPYVLWSFDWSKLQSGMQAFLDSNPWSRRIIKEARIQGGIDDVPYTRQYVGTTPVLYHFQNLVLWGLSPIPGLAVVTGALAAIWRAIRGRPAEILLLSGAIPYFWTILGLEAKWMRYMLPLVPILCIMGAAFLVRGIRWQRARYANRPRVRGFRRGFVAVHRNAFAVVTGAAILGAFLWSVAFSNIYTQEHSRVQASEWFFANVPDGAVRSAEAWDDALPMGIPSEPGKPVGDPSRYGEPVSFDLYPEKPPEDEFSYVKGLIQQTDYIILASNRLYGSIPRLPWRYQVQTEFYKLLFEGKLGYRLVHTSLVTPEIFGMKIYDQSADESFTVYDHPRVDIYQKVSSLTDDQLRLLFSPALVHPVQDYSAARHGTVTDDKSLQYDQPLASMPDVNDFSWNPLAQNDTQWIGVILWLLVVQVLGFLALPIVFTIARNLPDKGYAFAKLIGLMLVSWGSWILASAHLAPFTVWSLLGMVVVMGGLSAVCWRLGAGAQIRSFFSTKARLIIFYEGVFLAAFAVFLWLRILNPDLWQPWFGGEKPMEFGFLNSILRSPWMPPADPFFSGGYINYYYQGQFMVASLIKLVGVDPGIGVNLAIALLYGLCFMAAASIGYNIVAWAQRRHGSTAAVSRKGMVFGFAAGFLMLVVANMAGFLQFMSINFPQIGKTVLDWAHNTIGLTNASIGPGYTTWDFWGPSRIIPNTINEFPYWTYLFADLHPHLINMPFTVAAVGLALNLAFAPLLKRNRLAEGEGASDTWFGWMRRHVGGSLAWLWGEGWSGVLTFAVSALALGLLFAVNSWDFPTFMVLLAGGVLIAVLRVARLRAKEAAPDGEEPRMLPASDRWSLYLTSFASVGLLAGLALLAYLPFFLNFKAFFTQILPLVDGGTLPDGEIMHRTQLPEFLLFWFIFVFIAVSYLIVRLWRYPWHMVPVELRALFGNRAEGGQAARQTLSAPGAAFKRLSVLWERPATARLGFAANGASADGPTGEPPDGVDNAGEVPVGVEQATVAASNGADGGAGQEPVLPPRLHRRAVSVPSVDESPAPPESVQEPELFPRYSAAESLAEVSPDYSVPGDGAAAEAPVEHLNGVSWPQEEHEGASYVLEPVAEEITPGAGNWVAQAHSEARAQSRTATLPAIEQVGVIPAWVGAGLLVVTAAIVVLELATGQMLLAFLAALLGGIAATTLASSRSASTLFTGALLVGALAVVAGVELVYLADHLRGGGSYRMNTVFKFYIQGWVLFALGGAAALYNIFFGGRRRADAAFATTSERAIEESSAPAVPAALPPAAGLLPAAHDGSAAAKVEKDEADDLATGPLPDNWLAWSATDFLSPEAIELNEAPQGAAETQAEQPVAEPAQTSEKPAEEPASVLPAAAPQAGEPVYVAAVHEEQPAEPVAVGVAPPEKAESRLSLATKIVWAALFALVLFASVTYTFFGGTQARIAQRFDQHPPVGTLNGMDYMKVGTFTTEAAPWPINLKYDYEAIEWMNKNIHGEHVIAERVMGYYREDGMRAAANTGFPMVVGGLHQDEQRYDWEVGDRRRDMEDFFSNPDIQTTLTYINKYNIEYIYFGQLEQAKAGEAGAQKFAQMADPKVGILKEVFKTQTPEGFHGTTIYQVVKDTRELAGAPVAGSGIPGISITPVPTRTPTPMPTPPTNDPALKALIDDVAANPTDAGKRMKLVDWYRTNGFHLEAAHELETLVTQNPSDIATRHQLGDEYQAAGQPDKALKAWEDARDVAPNNPAAHNKVGIAYRERRRYDDAIKEFQAAVSADANFNEAYFQMAQTYEAKGDLDNAKKQYQATIDHARDPNDSWASAARKRLDELK